MRCDPDPTRPGRRLPRRATDRVEDAVAWLLTAAGLVLVIVAVMMGVAAHSQQAEAAGMASWQTRAVLLEDAEIVSADELGRPLPMRVPARWTDRSGVEHTSHIQVKTTAAAGTEVDVWLYADGRVLTTPLGREIAVAAGILSAAVLLISGGVVLGAAWHGVRRLTAACNDRRWEQEWVRVGPEWSGRPL